MMGRSYKKFQLRGVLLVSRSALVFVALTLSIAYLCIFSDIHSFQNVLRTQTSNGLPKFKCIRDVFNGQTKCKPVCGRGYFGLYGMKKCHRWLDCDGIRRLRGYRQVHTGTVGYVKEVWISQWKGYDVVVKRLRRDLDGPVSRQEFHYGIQLLQDFSNRSEVLQFVGNCNDTLVTEYHTMADATNLEKWLHENKPYNTVFTRFQLCIDFVRIMTVFHSGEDGKVYVHCDANTEDILLQQYLLTDDLRLVISDVDALTSFEKHKGMTKGGKCLTKTDRDYSSPFNAPEQRVDHNSKMLFYNEKIDVWKIPDACKRFLKIVLPSLKNIHEKCKSKDPNKRPTAQEVLKRYEVVYQMLTNASKTNKIIP